MTAPLRIACLLLLVTLGITGCAAGTTPGATPTESVASKSASGVAESPFDGRWVTGPVPIDEIKASMVEQGLTSREVEAWAKEVGSPTEYAFELNFASDTFSHSEETPQMAMQVGESGTYAYSGTSLILSMGDPGNVDTYTFAFKLDGDDLTLRWLESTEQGTAEDKANHRRYTLAFYCSTAFWRQQ